VGKASLNAAQPYAKAEGRVFLLVLAYPGCPGTKAVKRSLLLLYGAANVGLPKLGRGRPRHHCIVSYCCVCFSFTATAFQQLTDIGLCCFAASQPAIAAAANFHAAVHNTVGDVHTEMQPALVDGPKGRSTAVGILDVLSISVAEIVLCAMPCKSTVQYDPLISLYWHYR